jgi:4-hydroxybenzoate polyprenyltransferase
MNFVTIILGVMSIPLIALYPLMKRITWWPQAFLGLTFNFGALMGWSAVTGTVQFPALLLYAGGIFWTLGYDTIYAHQDKEDDALAGIKSTALKFGQASKKMVAIFFGAAWILIAASATFADFHSMAFLFLLPAMVHMVWQVMRWNMNYPVSSLKIFKSNRDFGLLVLAAFMLA